MHGREWHAVQNDFNSVEWNKWCNRLKKAIGELCNINQYISVSYSCILGIVRCCRYGTSTLSLVFKKERFTCSRTTGRLVVPHVEVRPRACLSFGGSKAQNCGVSQCWGSTYRMVTLELPMASPTHLQQYRGAHLYLLPYPGVTERPLS